MTLAKIPLYCSIFLISWAISPAAYGVPRQQNTDCGHGRFNRSVCGNVEGDINNNYNVEGDDPNSPLWRLNKSYNPGDVVVYKGKRYRCIQGHRALAYNWTPPQTPALWERE